MTFVPTTCASWSSTESVFDPTPETSKEPGDVKWGLVLLDRIADAWGRISEGGIWAEFRIDRSD